jgi:hypothetical protein
MVTAGFLTGTALRTCTAAELHESRVDSAAGRLILAQLVLVPAAPPVKGYLSQFQFFKEQHS